MGLGATADPAVVCEVGGLVSPTDQERAETWRGGDGDGAGLGLSLSHDGPSLEEEAALLVLMGSLALGEGWWMLVGNSLRGGHVSTGARDLTSQSELSFRSFKAYLILLKSFLLCTAAVVKPPVHQVALHEVNVLVAGDALVAQRSRLIGFLNQNVLEKEKFHRHQGGTDNPRVKVIRRSPDGPFWGVSEKAAVWRCWWRREGGFLRRVWMREAP